jgi:capsular polysaccharide biosynthesis protein
MTIQEYIRILRRRGWIIGAAMVLAAVAAFGVSFLQEDLYSANVYVSTVPARPDWGLGNTAKDLMRNFATNIQTPELAQKVIDRAQLDMNRFDLLGNLQVEPDSSTFTVKIQARNRDGEVAKLIALTVADEFIEERTAYYAQQDKDNRIEVKAVSREIGYEQIQPKPVVNAVAGGVLGLLFGIAIVLLLTWMEADLLRTPAAVERTLGIPVLSAIPYTASLREVARPVGQAGRVAVPKTA